MARGKYYTIEEDERLLKLYNDLKGYNKKITFKDVAEKAIEYGIVSKHRNANAVAQHLKNLLDPPETDEENKEEQTSLFNDPERAEGEKYRTKYEGLLSAVIDEATLYEGPAFKALRYNYQAISKWLAGNEADRVWARIETLEMER